MRLLDVTTLQMADFFGVDVPRYAILSHTWGREEVSYQDMLQGRHSQVLGKKGASKIQAACLRARRDDLHYVWIDTCCIDKTSSAELSEAINSMFAWYKRATVCYAYLDDVNADLNQYAHIQVDTAPTPKELDQIIESDFARSRWFTRGWTLQELIAPQNLKFYGADWKYIGEKKSMAGILSHITGVEERILAGRMQLNRVSVAQKLSWASSRVTTRVEDMSYCLLGIFDINMPLLYGEGSRAFERFQEEIARTTNDQSLFAWETTGYDHGSLLAPDISCFSRAGKIITWDRLEDSGPFAFTNSGLEIRLPSLSVGTDPTKRSAILACPSARIFRIASQSHRLAVVDIKAAEKAELRDVFILRMPSSTVEEGFSTSQESVKIWVRLEVDNNATTAPEFEVVDSFPPQFWNRETLTFWMRKENRVQGAVHLLSKDGDEFVIAVGFTRTKTRFSISSFSSQWVHIMPVDERLTLEQLCHQASIVQFGVDTATTSHFEQAQWTVEAAINLSTIMGEVVFVADVNVSQR
ncbi:uncharacterized protein JN550_012744 [Neoarthrinium moseri]|uniref:uncharacterized protein n=1 Tax=Neoarthrinium moseri TaxID=1658444 RepID=UPI001FDD4BFF|nr:uncharacterized protein JN550_012744 [Neoarthrinium moseri]KAI1858379.1 hypothetical protein JN550_012744 [Neoarthrinium moseri]